MSDTNFEILQKDAALPFDPARFNIDRHPEVVGQALPDRRHPSCLDMLVKIPKGDLILPAPYREDAELQRAFDQIISFEDRLLPNWRDTHYVYLTYDNRMVEEGKSHRRGGWHFDGMQGERYKDMPLLGCHQYLMASCFPTEFHTKGVDATDLDVVRDNWFEVLGARADAQGQPFFVPQAGEITLMTTYSIHRSPVIACNIRRTIVRIEFTEKKFDRLGNSENPDLPAPWDWVPRPMPFFEAKSSATWEGSKRF